MTEEVVTIEGVSFYYGETCVLQEANLSIEEGSFIGLIGPNGGGKTTLLRLLMGFLKPTSGRIRVLGKDPAESRNRISYVPQNLIYDRSFPITVEQVVLTGLLHRSSWWGSYSKEEVERAHHELDRMELIHLAKRSFGSLSGGQAQRVLLARSLASDPKLLLLDEPTSNMDPALEAKTLDLFDDLRKEMTLMMVTHDLQTIIRRVQKIVCVQQEVIPILPEKVCEHFALGLYHHPLMDDSDGKDDCKGECH